MNPTFEEFPKLPVVPRFSVYIDGYNLYGAINHPKPEYLFRLGWCDYQRLCELLVEKSFACSTEKPAVTVKYFTVKVDEGTPNQHKGEMRCPGSAGNGEQAFSVSEYSALRAGIFKAWGSFDPMPFGRGAEPCSHAPLSSSR